MNDHLEQAADALFPFEGARIGNVKFFQGRTRDVGADQFAEELMSANRQIAEGTARRVEDIDGD